MAPTVLYIVSRDRPALYEHLKRQFAGTGTQVILDRRTARPSLNIGDRVVLWRYNPLLPQRLVGRDGVVLEVGRVRAVVQFDQESKRRHVDVSDLKRTPR
jgi:hypothetical protein